MYPVAAFLVVPGGNGSPEASDGTIKGADTSRECSHEIHDSYTKSTIPLDQKKAGIEYARRVGTSCLAIFPLDSRQDSF